LPIGTFRVRDRAGAQGDSIVVVFGTTLLSGVRKEAMFRAGTTIWRSLAVIAVIGVANPALGHHSFAMFDTGTQVTLAGVVTAFEWTNPHVYIELDVPDGRGVKHWTIELGSTSILMRGGWKFNTLKHGDKVTAVVDPLRSGEPGSLLSRITLPDGRVLGNGGPPPATATPPADATKKP
jgi:uncharacterized protein DUF6152